jgi:hypothetical protein
MTPHPNQIRFPVEPRLVPAVKAARRLHLTEADFREKLPALLRAGMPAACSVTGHYDLKAIDTWLDARAGIGEHEGKPKRNVMDGLQERLALIGKPIIPKAVLKEREESIRREKLRKREQRSLGAYYRAKDGPDSALKGGGYETVKRLMARGYIVSAVPDHDPLLPVCKITPEGEAAWLRINGGENVKK